MNTTKFKLELGTIPESIPELTPVAIESDPKSITDSELKLKRDSEPKESKTEEKTKPEPEAKIEAEAKIEDESQQTPDSELDVNESIKTLTQSINYHDYVDSLPHFIEHDKPKIKKVMFNFETIIPNEPIIPNESNESINLQKDIPELDSDDSYCTCIL